MKIVKETDYPGGFGDMKTLNALPDRIWLWRNDDKVPCV